MDSNTNIVLCDKGKEIFKMIFHIPYSDISKFLKWTHPLPKICPSGTIDKVENNFPDIWGKHVILQLDTSVYFGSFTWYTYRTGGLKHPVYLPVTHTR